MTYTYSVSNIGNETLDPVTVTDPMPGLSQHLLPLYDAGPRQPSGTCTATYTTIQADVDAGKITNTGTATAPHLRVRT